MNTHKKTDRRDFVKKSGLLASTMIAAPLMGSSENMLEFPEKSIYLIGPQKGYTPHVGTLLSTMTMMRTWVINSVKDLNQKALDFQIDDQSNSIGAMLLHLAATEKYYQLNTFDDLEWGSWGDEIKEEWDIPMQLGENARSKVKGHKIGYYLTKLKEVRDVTEKEFAKRDDDWLMKSAPFFGNQPTNNYCKWFHVCEHESNHNGQIKFIKKRLPA